MNSTFTKRFSILLILFSLLSAQSVFAKDNTDYDALAKEGTVQEIQAAIKAKSGLKTQVFGNNRETFLMLALKYDRPPEVIDVLLKADMKVEATAKDKKTPLMFACQYTTHPEIIETLITHGTVFASARKKRCTAKDSSGKTPFDYAKLNETCDTYSPLLKYASDPGDKTTTAKTTNTVAEPSSDPATDRSNTVTFTYGAQTAPASDTTASTQTASQTTATQESSASTSRTNSVTFTYTAPAAKTAETQTPVVEAETVPVANTAQTAPSQESASASRTNSVTFTYTAPAQQENTATSAAPQAPLPETLAAAPAAQQASKTQETTVSADQSQPVVNAQETVNQTLAAAQAEAVPVAPAQTVSVPTVTQTAAPVVVESITPVAPSEPVVQAPVQDITQLLPSIQAEPVQQTPAAQASQQPQKQTEIRQYTQTNLFDYAIMEDTVPQEEQTKRSVTFDNPNLADENGVTLLMKAAKAGNDWDVKNLLDAGADVQLRDKDGWTALMYAVRYQNSASIVKMLIDSGAHIRVRNIYNATPLLLAADYSQNPEIISLLLDNRSATENEVYNAFILALTSNIGATHVQMAKIQLFLDMDISLNRIWKGKTPLMYAAQYSTSTEVIQLLLDNGARTSIQDSNGKTAFDYAKQNSHLEHNETYWSLNGGM